MSAWAWAVDALVVAGLAATTAAVAGILRLPRAFARLHAAGLAVATGAVLVLAACALAGPPATSARALLVALCVLLTAPVGTHALAALADARERGTGDEASGADA